MAIWTQEQIDYEARWKLQLDKASYQKELELVRAEGYAQGWAEGYAQGLAEGKCISRIQLSQRVLNQPESCLEALEPLTLAELQAMAADLERQLFTGTK